MAEMVDAPDSKSGWSNIQCGFESHLSDKIFNCLIFNKLRTRSSVGQKQQTHNLKVVGSSPSGSTYTKKH